MAKFHTAKLPKEEMDTILYAFCEAVAHMKNPQEAAELLRDLLSPQETEMIAMRLKIAELLETGHSYVDIGDILKVSQTTIARVQSWLRLSGEGYRRAISRATKQKISREKIPQMPERDSWSSIKRRYPMYHWPELLLQEIVVNADRRQQEKMRAVLRKMKKAKLKTPLYSQIERLIHEKNLSGKNRDTASRRHTG